MGKLYEEISERLKEFMESSPVFFVATAPGKLSESGGHINVSPKGKDSFRVIHPNQVAYLDLTGSGAETIAHLRDNGNITIMFAAFAGKPNIIRLYGKGETILPDAEEFPELISAFTSSDEAVGPGIRSVIKIDVERISDSCGFGVPLMDFVGEREEMTKWSQKKGAEGLAKYQAEKNTQSIDGLPALDL